MGRGRKSRRHLNNIEANVVQSLTMPEIYPTAIYVRLSVENLGRSDNGTIENQKDVCREYVAQCPDLKLIKIYEDNGWTGTVMQRPAFDEMMEAVKSGVIKAIVVRDLSRFARNYIEAGTYLENVFPELGVRFISIKEQLDTLKVGDATENLIVPLQNLINDFYSKDISRKVETALAVQIREGTFRWRVVPYGYRKNDGNTTIVPDELRADIVRQIFKWKAEGMPIAEIVRKLNSANAPKADVSYSRDKPWIPFTVNAILKNPVYTGLRILGKEHSAIYKGIHREKTTSENWHFFPDAVEPLIDKEVYDKIQVMFAENAQQRRAKMAKTAAARAKLKDNFEGKIFCADCGYRMQYSRHQFSGKYGWYGCYVCSSNQSKRLGTSCSSHYISQKKLEEKVLTVIKTHIQIAVDYEKLVVRFQGSESDKKNRYLLDMAVRKATQKLSAAQRKRIRLYEDYVAGTLDKEEYIFAKKSYEEESETWNKRLEEIVAQKNAYQEAMSPRNLWIKAMRKVKNIKKLTRELLDATVARIEIYDGGDIHIVMNYQDIFDLTKGYLEGGEPNA